MKKAIKVLLVLIPFIAGLLITCLTNQSDDVILMTLLLSLVFGLFLMIAVFD